MPITLSQLTHLKRFVKHVKAKLADPYVCNNIVSRVKTDATGKQIIIKYRCHAGTGPNGCYICDYTGYSCMHCGDSIAKGKSFCSRSCSGQYYAY